MKWPYFLLFPLLFLALDVHAQPFGVCSHFKEANYWHKLPPLGIEWVRIDLSWYHVESQPGVYDFESIDKALNIADSLGIKVLAILGYTPIWAASGPNHKFAPRKEYTNAWLHYIDTMAIRYSHKIAAWEVWNEPDHYAHLKTGPFSAGWFHDSTASETNRRRFDFASYVVPAVQRLKTRLGPRVLITTSGLGFGGQYDSGFYRFMRELGPGYWNHIDALSLHTYGYPGNKSLWKTLNIGKFFKSSHPEKQVWITEHGIIDYRKKNIQQDSAAMFLLQNFGTSLGNGVSLLFWYRLTSEGDYAALLDETGKPTPFYFRFMHLYGKWNKAHSFTPYLRGDSIQGISATLTNGAPFAVIWSQNGKASLPTAAVLSAWDWHGKKLESEPISVTSTPILIQLPK